MVVIVMGVAGSGKTTVGAALARRLGWPLLEADDFHPASNIEKMAQGRPLSDADRWPWLDGLNAAARKAQAQGRDVVMTCSALREVYRERLSQGLAEVCFVHLTGSREVLLERLTHRPGHFMKPGMLESQLSTLEPPSEGPDTLLMNVDHMNADQVVDAVVGWLDARR